MIYTEVTKKALKLCFEAHKDQKDKSGIPYVFHPFHLAEQMTDELSTVCALLHDVVEDAGVSMEEIEAKFGRRVRELVASETEDKRADLPPSDTWRIRKEESLEKLRATNDIEVLMLWIGDKLSNIRAIYRDFLTEGDAVWDKFHQSDINVQAWYYRSIMKYTERLSDTLAWIEYKTLVEKIFGAEE